MRNIFTRSDRSSLKIGDKRVHPKKIPVAQWKELFDSIQLIPQLLISVISAPQSERAGYLVVALRESFDDVVRVTSILTGLDEEYIEKNAAVDELIAFYKAVVEVNNFGELLKNGLSVLGTVMPNLTKTEQAQDAG